MNTETQVAPVAETQNTAAEPTTAELVTPEATEEAQPQTSEKDERDKAIARMERRINRKHAEAASASERARIAEERLRDIESRQPSQAPEKIQVDPREVQRAIQTQAQALREQDRINDRLNSFVNRGNKDFPDFAQSLQTLANDLPLLRADGRPTDALEEILEMDNPAAVARYLSKNPDVAQELADLTPRQLTRRLIQLEGEMKTTRQPSSAPKPLEPVRGASQKNMPDPVKDPAAWRKWRNETAGT